MYVLAYSMVRGDEQPSGAERIYLAQLANLLGIDVATVQELEQKAASRIDAQPGGKVGDSGWCFDVRRGCEPAERDRMSQQQWYMAIGGHQVGPVSQDDVITNLRNGTIDGNTLVFTEGLKNWTPLKDVPQLASFLAGTAGAGAARRHRWCPDGARTTSTSASSAARCSSSRWSSIRARAPSPKPAR